MAKITTEQAHEGILQTVYEQSGLQLDKELASLPFDRFVGAVLAELCGSYKKLYSAFNDLAELKLADVEEYDDKHGKDVFVITAIASSDKPEFLRRDLD